MSQRRRITSAILMSTASMAVATSVAHASPPPVSPAPPPDAQVDKRLIALRADLLSNDRATVLAQMKVYRPLCDAHGYPLVGNLATKGAMFQPSEFCAKVREAEAPAVPAQPDKAKP